VHNSHIVSYPLVMDPQRLETLENRPAVLTVLHQKQVCLEGRLSTTP
jgi:hypothetical protein